jgi:octaprenyl-diphosphate synthase
MQLARLQQMKIIALEDYDAIIQAKTAELFGVACEVGAIIAGQTDDICAKMKDFGALLGAIFQIADDILDYFGDTSKIGKNIGDDFLEGKVTLPLIMLDKTLSLEEKNILETMLANTTRTPEDFKWVQNILCANEILLELKNHLYKLSDIAKDSLQKIPGDSIYKQQMHNLIEFAVNRTF